MKVFKTTVLGMGPWCVEFPDGEIVTVKTEARANAIARIGTIEQAKGPLRPHTGEAMSLVKWAAQYELDSYTKEDIEEANEIAVPVIPLADLADVVEGLKLITEYNIDDGVDIDSTNPIHQEWLNNESLHEFYQWLAQRLLTQLEAQGPCNQCDGSGWYTDTDPVTGAPVQAQCRRCFEAQGKEGV